MKKLLKIHRTIGLISLMPLLLLCLSGIILEFRNQINWLSPSKPKISKSNLPFKWITSKEVMDLHLKENWGNSNAKIKTILYNIEERVISIRTADDFEYNLHGETGVLLSSGKKRSLFFNRIHQELFFGNNGKLLIVFPTAIMLLFLLFSGGILILKRQKNAKRI